MVAFWEKINIHNVKLNLPQSQTDKQSDDASWVLFGRLKMQFLILLH